MRGVRRRAVDVMMGESALGERKVAGDVARDDVPHKRGLPRMPRVDAVWNHAVYQREYLRLAACEAERPFCRHQVDHLMSAARIMWIANLEHGYGLDREVVYAAALLHDIGKAEQYEHGTPHEEAGARLAASILESLPPACSFSDEERQAIVTAIRGHRRLRDGAEVLERLLFQADKASRACFACPPEVRAACSWSDAKKNRSICV